jgi:hypothetical protein
MELKSESSFAGIFVPFRSYLPLRWVTALQLLPIIILVLLYEMKSTRIDDMLGVFTAPSLLLRVLLDSGKVVLALLIE